MGNTCNTNNCSQNPPPTMMDHHNMDRLPMEVHHSLENLKAPIIEETIYEKIGGRIALYAAIDAMFTKALEDQQISHYFKYVDMDRLKDCMKKLQVYVIGGPFQYKV